MNDTRSKHVLFVNAGYVSKKRSLVTAKEMGLRLSVVGPTLPEWARPYVDGYIPANTYDLADTVASLSPVHAYTPFDGVATFWDRDVEIVAGVAAALGLPGAPVEAAALVRNKYRCREALATHAVPQPQFGRFTNREEMATAAGRLGFPLICKPIGAAGSKGVFKVDTEADLSTVFDMLVANVRPEIDPLFSYHAGQYVLEQFMTGREFSVEGIVCRGSIHVVGITEKWATSDFFTEYQHAFPARLGERDAASISRIAEDAVSALGLDNCGFHVEVMLGERGPRIVEVNGRLGGDLITSHLVPLASGIDLVRAALLTALGEDPEIERRASGASCIRYLLAQSDGTVAGWRGVGVTTDLPGVVELTLEKEQGDLVVLPPAPAADHRLCYVVTQDEDTEGAIRRAEAALAGVDCVVTS